MVPSSGKLEIAVELEELKKEQGWPNLVAYVFNRQGRLLAKQSVKPDKDKATSGNVEFDLPLDKGQVIVKIGPDVGDITELERYNPVVNQVLLTPGKKAVLKSVLATPIWRCWFKIPYWVTGTVEKREPTHTAPICYGEVDIYDVDIKLCFLKLPDPIIERIRDGIIDILTAPPPVDLGALPSLQYWDDDDWCGTKPKPPFPPKAIDIAGRLETLPAQWAFAKQRYAALPTARSRMDDTLNKLGLQDKQALLSREAAEGIKISQILYTNTAQFRELLAEKFASVRFWLCWYPWIYWLWWPFCWWYGLEKLGTATLQHDGSFSARLWLSVCRNDIPDLWFVVRQKINGVERVIYARRPVPCNTYWDHPSGKPVHLVVTDPNALACQPEPTTDQDDVHLWIVPLAIGAYSLKRIYGTGAGPLPMSNTNPLVGQYEAIGTGLGGALATFSNGPFGGTLGLRYLFSPALEAAKVKYYRIKYRVNGTGEWTPLTSEVVRHYSHYDAALDVLEFPAYSLGPRTIGAQSSLFEIPPQDPPNKGTEPDATWFVYNPYVDLSYGFLDSTQMRAGSATTVSYGYVDFKLELFDVGGNRVNPATFGGGIPFKLPANDDVWKTITTVNPASVNPDLVVPDPEDSAFQTFIFRLRVNNRQPTAFIYEPQLVSSGETSGSCGVMHYRPGDTSVTMRYQATHPDGFAMYQFALYRGPDQLRAEQGRAISSGNLTFDPAASQIPTLLGSCSEAVFSENLYIWNMNFNGWSRVGPDASMVRAFALAKYAVPVP